MTREIIYSSPQGTSRRLSTYLLLVVSLVVLAIVTATTAQGATSDNCKPENGLNVVKCALKRRTCAAKGIYFKFAGAGCRVGNRILKDGGCQCVGYCGYMCSKKCNLDKQCYWNATAAACYSQLTLTKGGPVPQCPITSAPSTSPSVSPTPYPVCFHRDSQVSLSSGAKVALTDLKYGDYVAAFDPETKQVVYSEVIAFSSYRPNELGEGLRIEYEGGYLVLSSEHMVYASTDGVAPSRFYMASELSRNSVLYGDSFTPRTITNIKRVVARGWITPLTKTGTVIVNGLMTSCHTRAHYIMRTLYTPVYWYLSVFPREKGSIPEPEREIDIKIGNNVRYAISSALDSIFKM